MKKSLGLKLSSLLASFALVMSLLVPTFAASSTIKLTEDRSEFLTVGAGETQVLDLNGYVMTGKVVNDGTLTIIDSKTTGKVSVTGDHAIFNKGTLTIGGGTFDALSHGKAALWNEPAGTVTINGGTFLRSNENGSNATNSGGNSYYNVLNHGNMTINGGTVFQSGKFSSLVENGWQNGTQNVGRKDSKLVINGGTFDGGLNTIKNDDYGNLKIVGGTFKNVAQASLLNWNVAEITGGIFTSDNGVIVNAFGDATMDKGELTISGGVFNSGGNKTIISQFNPSPSIGTIVITAGTYNNTIGVNVKSGYKVYTVGDTFKVAPMTTEVKLSSAALDIEVGKTAQLTSTLTPSQTLDKVAYTSSDEAVATIGDTGLVTAKKVGTTTITATAGGKTATCTVTVKDVPVQPETPDVPTIEPSDPTTPSNSVEVGIKDDASKAVITNTVDNILKDILGGKVVPTSVMSADTVKAVKEALASGKTVVPVVENKLVKESEVAKELVTKVNELVAKLEKTNGTNATVAQYLDLGVTLTADDKELGSVNKLEKPVTFTVTLPKELQKDGRVFYVVRIHDGVAEKLETTMTNGTATFKTDRFSTYALVYEEKVSTGDTVKTSDNSQVMLFASAAGLALVAAGLVVLYKKRDELLNK